MIIKIPIYVEINKCNNELLPDLQDLLGDLVLKYSTEMINSKEIRAYLIKKLVNEPTFNLKLLSKKQALEYLRTNK